MPSQRRDAAPVWLAVNSLVGLAVGATTLLWPDLSATALLYAIAMWAIAMGVIEFVAALVLPHSGAAAVLQAVSGIVITAFGVVMFTERGDGAIALLALVAALRSSAAPSTWRSLSSFGA